MRRRAQRGPRTSGVVGLLVLVVIAWLRVVLALPPEVPNADVYDTDGPVFAIAQSGDIIYVGGSFSAVGPQEGITNLPRGNLAAIDATTGEVTSWNPGVEGIVYALGVSDDGRTIYVGGDISSVGGQVRNRIAAIDAASGVVTDWNPDANGAIESIAVYDSTVYVGGNFTEIGGTMRNFIAALDADTGLATSWNPGANGTVEAIAVSGSTVYAAGGFTNIGQQPRHRLAALDAVTGTATAWDPDANSNVYALTLSKDGSTVYVGGFFNMIGGQARNFIAAVDADTGRPTPWAPNANSVVYALSVSSDDSVVYAGGFFNSIGGQVRNYVAALDADTGLAMDWNPSPISVVWAVYATVDTVYVGGWFSSVGGGMVAYFAYFGDLFNSAPNAPSELGPLQYVDGSSGTDLTPAFTFVQSDPDLDDLLAYHIQIDDSRDFGSPTVDVMSDYLQPGAVTFTCPSLPVGTYYWRVRSLDEEDEGEWALAAGEAVAFEITQPAVDFVDAAYNVGESDGWVTVTVQLSGPSDETILVDYATNGVTAQNVDDYQSEFGTLVFDPGQIEQSVLISILDDELDEPDEIFVVELIASVHATLGTASNPTTITIVDNDEATEEGEEEPDDEPDDGGDGQEGDGDGDGDGGEEGDGGDSEEDEGGDEDSVTLCHIPPGNPSAAHTIVVGSSAVAAHLAHGDTLGACDDDEDDDGADGSSEEEEEEEEEDDDDGNDGGDDDEGDGGDAGDDDNEDHVTLCHIPPGKPSKAHTIVVGASAVAAHLGHGDYLGACEGEGDRDGSSLKSSTEDLKATLCHVPPGRTRRAHTIAVDQSVVDAHLGYGDYLGACAGTDQVHGESENEHLLSLAKKVTSQQGPVQLALVAQDIGAHVRVDDIDQDIDEELELSARLEEGLPSSSGGIDGAMYPLALEVQVRGDFDRLRSPVVVSMEVNGDRLVRSGLRAERSGLFRRAGGGTWQCAGVEFLGNSVVPDELIPGQAGYAEDPATGKIEFWVVDDLQEMQGRSAVSSHRVRSSAGSILVEYAVGEYKFYELNVFAEPSHGGRVLIEPDEGSYRSGSSVTLQAVSHEGYEFVGWVGAETSGNSITLPVNRDRELTAVFQLSSMFEPEDTEENLDDAGNSPDEEVSSEVDTDDHWEATDAMSICGVTSQLTLLLTFCGLLGMRRSRRSSRDNISDC